MTLAHMSKLVAATLATPNEPPPPIGLLNPGGVVIDPGGHDGVEVEHSEWCAPGTRRSSGVSHIRLDRGSYRFPVPARRMLVSYVLRHSPAGMDVRSSEGQRGRLTPGAMLLCHGPELVVHRGPTQRSRCCDVIDLLLPIPHNPGVFVQLDDCYPTFVNSAQACIRLLMGAWEGHQSLLQPLGDFWLLDIDVAPGEDVTLRMPALGAIGVLTTGSLRADGRCVDLMTPALLAQDGGALTLATETGASLLLFPHLASEDGE